MYDDVSVLRERARVLVARGDLDGASAALWSAATQTHVPERDYMAVLRQFEDVLARRGDARAALTVIAYAASSQPAAWSRARSLFPLVTAPDRAMAAAAQGQLAEAAREMESAGRIAAAAIYREKAGEWSTARALWSRLVHAAERTDAYVAALVRFNLARCARRCDDAERAREATVACVRLLEEAADHFESVGQRERAFDCFQVLVQVGREGGAFEDVLEGFVNCIRILREDHLKQFALEYYDAAIAAAAERGETSAAATFASEAGDYARSLGLASAGASYTVRQAELWRTAARQHTERGAPVDVTANALLAAILAFAEVGQYARVGQLYAGLALLDLDPSRREYYAQAARRYDGASDEPLETSTAVAHPSRVDNGLNEVWHADVLEWEQHGNAAEACAEVMLDKRWLELIRRKAMLARIAALRVEARVDDPNPESLNAVVRLADQLAQLQHYAVLSPLEAMYAHTDRPALANDPAGSRRVRIAVLEALHVLSYKRSFVTLRAALRDPDPAIVARAAKTVEEMQFEHAFDPLSRIFRESPAPNVRTSALKAMARIDTQECAEFLMNVLQHGTPSDRFAALAAVKGAPRGQFIELARASLPRAPEPLRAKLREVLQARGMV
jgi:hypothetical protein